MEDYIKQALEITKAQARVRTMTEEEISSMIQKVSNQLKSITETGAIEDTASEAQKPAVDPKKALNENSVFCLECGKRFKVLSKRHLAVHGLSPEEYREKWGFKKNTPLVAKSLVRQRRKKMQEMQIWKKRKKA
jgi:predicted transcriptional regulator